MTESQQLNEAIRHIRAGNRHGGQAILRILLREDWHNHQAWLWLSSTLESREEQRYCLERIREIAAAWREAGDLQEPDSLERALAGLSALGPGQQRRPALFDEGNALLARFSTPPPPDPVQIRVPVAPPADLNGAPPAGAPTAPGLAPQLQREIDTLARALARDPIALGRWLGYGQRLKDELD